MFFNPELLIKTICAKIYENERGEVKLVVENSQTEKFVDWKVNTKLYERNLLWTYYLYCLIRSISTTFATPTENEHIL